MCHHSGSAMQGTARFWPYTYMDCEFNEVYNLGVEGYCAGGQGDFGCPSCQTQCDFDWVQLRGHPRQDFIDMLDDMQAALVRCAFTRTPSCSAQPNPLPPLIRLFMSSGSECRWYPSGQHEV